MVVARGHGSANWAGLVRRVMNPPHPFEAFVREHQDLVYSTALRLLGDAAAAEDVAQEVFLRAFQQFEDLRDSPTTRGWLRTVATRLALTHLTRYRKRWQFFSEMSRPGDDPTDEPSHEPDFADPAANSAPGEAGDREAWVHKALMRLPDHQRVPLVLYHMEGLSYEEIARELGVSLAKVKTDLHRARLALRRQLHRQLGREGADLMP
ncbi:RNA polymerase sigma factor [Limisphaera ngatamarikiensis]|uniref:RNA polymerase sigma factor n=2 Tax=Limisphaera ngatamarikiensis TaxID=1324935 RepID=A0A6M1RNH1_9BACT|nr:RNA polymerase sigma factor [Limisphaera ngatamarikiensis]